LTATDHNEGSEIQTFIETQQTKNTEVQ